MADVRLLVISHNCFGKFNNMGKTLEGYFSRWNSDSIAQLYFSDEEPNSDYCRLFYRVSDKDVLKSLFKRSTVGTIKQNTDSDSIEKVNITRNNHSLKSLLIKYVRNRTPFVYCMRNLLWKMGKWDTAQLWDFIESFNPECIYYASGDYAFSYSVALKIAKQRNIPLVIGCVDDFYMSKKRTLNPFYYINRRIFMRTVNDTFSYAKAFTSICKLMNDAYEEKFGKEGYVLYTPTEIQPFKEKVDYYKGDIIYAGNLGYGRAKQLTEIGRCLNKISDMDHRYLHVYSGEVRKELTDLMCEENGIVFHGAVSPGEINKLIEDAAFVIHTESFEDTYIQRVQYSISTKISQNLASGTPMIAYGPCEVASIEYLKSENIAICINSQSALECNLRSLLNKEYNVAQIAKKAYSVALENHNQDRTPLILEQAIKKVVRC